MRAKNLAYPAPEFRDRLERAGYREQPGSMYVRVRRYSRTDAPADLIIVEYNGDVVHLYRPVTSQREAQQLSAKLKRR